MKKDTLIDGEYYHIYNRGVDKRIIFQDRDDYFRLFLGLHLLNCKQEGIMERWRTFIRGNPRAKLSEFQEFSSRQGFSYEDQLVEIIAYCLLPNHYHIVIKQESKEGIRIFMHKLGTSYTNYFNKKNERSGSLFQGTYNAVHIDSKELLPHLSVYVNCNYIIHGITDNDYQWSSLPDYLGKRNGSLCQKEAVLNQFKNIEDYKSFLDDNLSNIREIRELKKIVLQE